MSFKIQIEKQEINLEQEAHEPYKLFLDRVKFFLECINQNFNIEKSTSLSYVYRNKELYNAVYQEDLEELIRSIVNNISNENFE
jgi:hypothetical protein